jgi:hypothetical protein
MVQHSNSAQLHSLLMELSNSTFFRLFKVLMELGAAKEEGEGRTGEGRKEGMQ